MNENLANIESMLVGMLLILLLVAFSFLLIMSFLSSREKRNKTPILRAVFDIKIIEDAYTQIKNSPLVFSENIIQLTEGEKTSLLINDNNCIGVIILKNYGNSSAIDIELEKISYCKTLDSMENKLFSLSTNEHKLLLVNLPNDLTNNLGVQKISFKFKNINNNRFKSKFSYTILKTLTKELDEKTKLYVLTQV